MNFWIKTGNEFWDGEWIQDEYTQNIYDKCFGRGGGISGAGQIVYIGDAVPIDWQKAEKLIGTGQIEWEGYNKLSDFDKTVFNAAVILWANEGYRRNGRSLNDITYITQATDPGATYNEVQNSLVKISRTGDGCVTYKVKGGRKRMWARMLESGYISYPLLGLDNLRMIWWKMDDIPPILLALDDNLGILENENFEVALKRNDKFGQG